MLFRDNFFTHNQPKRRTERKEERGKETKKKRRVKWLFIWKDMHTTHPSTPPPSHPLTHQPARLTSPQTRKAVKNNLPTHPPTSCHPFTNLFFLLNILPPLFCLLLLLFLSGGAIVLEELRQVVDSQLPKTIGLPHKSATLPPLPACCRDLAVL